MFFDFDDRYTDVEPVGRAISLRDGIGLAVLVHVLAGLLLLYEQSLVSATDLSQVKRAFDLNGYVGIIYFLVTAVDLYVS